jgi:FkbM family methyltransferase
MVLDRADFAVSAFVTDGAYEPHVSAVISTYCQPGMSVIDIGANIGIHTVAFARLVGDSGRVLAIEPSSENCRLILASARQNGCDNVELVPLALDTKRGWAYFSHHVGSNGGLVPTSAPEYVEGGGWIVPTAALDEVTSDRVDFIKVDVEGAEGRAMGGALKTLERWRPIVVSEFSCEMLRRVSGMEPEAYLDLFADLGYRLHVIDRDEPGRLVALSPSELLSTWDDDLRIEDLLFLPA